MQKYLIHEDIQYSLSGAEEEPRLRMFVLKALRTEILEQLLCFDLLTRPKMPFKVVHRKEVTHPGRWKSEEVAQALRCVYITAWEFEGDIRPTN